jgi:LysR family transcriptional regulator, transcriptional activator for aaeXAB operon
VELNICKKHKKQVIILKMNNNPLDLAWELSVLGRCVGFGNISVAAQHVGLSQPQISRIVRRLEDAFEITLLDRSSRRLSHWTPEALRLTRDFKDLSKNFSERLLSLQKKSEQGPIRIGTLEGLYELASHLAFHLFKKNITRQIELDIYDLNELSEHFLESRLDLIFTSRELGNRKYPIWRQLGVQTMSFEGPENSSILTQSPSEEKRVQKLKPEDYSKTLISNSLALRRYWIQNFNAHGQIPSPLLSHKNKTKKSSQLEPVFIFGSEEIKEQAREIILSFDPFQLNSQQALR